MEKPEHVLLSTKEIEPYYTEALLLLQQLISIPSFSKEEDKTADLLWDFLTSKNTNLNRSGNNVWVINQFFDGAKPTVLLASHHDTVKPASAYTKDPFLPQLEEDKLYGLGSNDAGASLVAMLAAFLHFNRQENLAYNLVFVAAAEEEISGAGGIESVLPLLPSVAFGIAGEPTELELAVAERGLVVLDCNAVGKAGHAAREEGENALYKALTDVQWIRDFKFEKESPFLGPVKMAVTVMETPNKAHNSVPDVCRFVVDVRVNELYTLEEVVEAIQKNISSTVAPRSLRLRPNSISTDHPLVKAGMALGKKPYGSPTTSDKALMPFPVLKAGPGNSARSHTADEFIYLFELKEGIRFYINLLEQIL